MGMGVLSLFGWFGIHFNGRLCEEANNFLKSRVSYTVIYLKTDLVTQLW